jgi:hypothetical protein
MFSVETTSGLITLCFVETTIFYNYQALSKNGNKLLKWNKILLLCNYYFCLIVVEITLYELFKSGCYY